ncbi:hypothetical protein DPMN_187406 [Dreissena polymorpha]|uniref:Uncharacterized protein n=1 Tax=Dreissena polymorpha TaxID=45954 RepID=A0A9D4DQY6_DREPO|nr:hypothetical protein DPMN_187406 [Dreissena polymorpha]
MRERDSTMAKMRRYDDDSATIRWRQCDGTMATLRQRDSTMTTLQNYDGDSAIFPKFRHKQHPLPRKNSSNKLDIKTSVAIPSASPTETDSKRK